LRNIRHCEERSDEAIQRAASGLLRCARNDKDARNDEKDIMIKRHLDRYDYIGIALLALVIALFIAHFVVPDTLPPPEP
jgi:hypothetical protein